MASLHELVIDGDLASLQEHDESELRDYRDRNGSSLLHYAAGCGHENVCRHLLQFIDARSAKSQNNGRTPLHWAARNGHVEICKLLVLEFGVPVDALAKGQVTPLELAIWQCHLTTARCLVEELGANPSHPNSWGCHTAHWLGKCPIYNGDDDSKEQLRVACKWLFEECGVAYNTPNHHGQTPVHKAAYAGNFAVVEYLCMERGVVDDIRDNNNNTAADCAERSKNYELASWLRRHASAEVRRALQSLGLGGMNDSTPVPSLVLIRAQYIELAKVHHPDVAASITSATSWNSVCDSYQLLQSYWNDDPDLFDCQIRIRSRNRQLLEHLRLCWHSEWHREQNSSLEYEGDSELAEFQSRLVRLLSSESFVKSGLCLAQLPKEYEKNFHGAKVPSPRDFGYRKLIQLLQEKCPSIKIEVMSGKQALLRVAS